MKNVTELFIVDDRIVRLSNVEEKYVPFVRERLLLNSMRTRIFSQEDEKLLVNIRKARKNLDNSS